MLCSPGAPLMLCMWVVKLRLAVLGHVHLNPEKAVRNIFLTRTVRFQIPFLSYPALATLCCHGMWAASLV